MKRWIHCLILLLVASPLNAATFVQSATAEADPAVPTLSSAATAGNLLVFIAMERSGATAYTLPAGYSLGFERYPESGNASYRRSIYMAYKVAAGGETSVSIEANSTGTIKAILAEFALDGGAGENQWVFDAQATNDNGTTDNATTLSSGTTASVSGTRFLNITALGYRISSSASMSQNPTWTNDVNNNIEYIGTNNGRYLDMGYGTRTTSGTQESTASWGAGGETNTGVTTGIGVFDLVSGAAPTCTPMLTLLGVGAC